MSFEFIKKHKYFRPQNLLKMASFHIEKLSKKIEELEFQFLKTGLPRELWLLDNKACARLLGKSTRYLQNLRDQRRIGFYQDGPYGSITYSFDQIITFLKSIYHPTIFEKRKFNV